MSTVWRQVKFQIRRLHYFMLIAYNAAKKGSKLKRSHHLKTSKSKENPWHSNHFRLNCLLSLQVNFLVPFIDMFPITLNAILNVISLLMELFFPKQ